MQLCYAMIVMCLIVTVKKKHKGNDNDCHDFCFPR